MDFLKIPDNAYDKLVDKDHKLIQMDICAFITYLRQKNCSSSSVSTYLSGTRHFYNINGIDLHWKRIHKFEGEKEKRAEDRPYTHSEIKLLLEHLFYFASCKCVQLTTIYTNAVLIYKHSAKPL
jgi:hypothetical protein